MANPIEIRAFRISALGFLIISVLGMVFAVLAKSQAILLDGVYALVSVVMTVLAAQVARMVDKPSSDKFHFGYAHFEPLLNLIRGLMIFAVCAFAMVATVQVLLLGGREIHARIAIWYTALSAVWSVGIYGYQRRLARKLGSPILEVDARTWLVDGVLYVGETGAFIVYMLLEPTALGPWLRYAEPDLRSARRWVSAQGPHHDHSRGRAGSPAPGPTARGPARRPAANGNRAS
jgi:predicted Co/Zn/Cd cation transporter (cation efflux family)